MAEKNYNFDLIVSQFLGEGDKMVSVGPFGEGHINDTYAAVIENNGEKRRIIVQRINHSIFTDPASLMDLSLKRLSRLTAETFSERLSQLSLQRTESSIL